MLRATVDELRCPKCTKKSAKSLVSGVKSLAPRLRLQTSAASLQASETSNDEVQWGQLICVACGLQYPILDGVAVVMENLRDYLLTHAKGIARVLSADARELPKDLRRDFLEAFREQREFARGQIESDLESDRVMALYLMNHYLRASDVPLGGSAADEWVAKYWDHGPFAQIAAWARENRAGQGLGRVIELGCGVGGLGKIFAETSVESNMKNYLGIDSSFTSIRWARRVAFEGVKSLRVPFDLMHAQLGREVAGVKAWAPKGTEAGAVPTCDFIVGDLALPPVEDGAFDSAVAMNAIDMLNDPTVLPSVQHRLLKKGGVAIQSDPYIWNERAAKKLRAATGGAVGAGGGGAADLASSAAVVKLYQACGFTVEAEQDRIPWLFFKNARQIELYSVHLLFARK